MSLLDAFGQPAWRDLVFALLHTLWQGAVIALLAALALRFLPARRQEARYLVALAAQFGVLVAGLVTWAALGYDPPRPAEPTRAGGADRFRQLEAGKGGWGPSADPGATARASAAGVRGRTPATRTPGFVDATGEAKVVGLATPEVDVAPTPWVPFVAVGWLVGVGLMLAGSAVSALAALRLTRGSPPADRAILDAVERLGRELGIGRPVRVVATEGTPGPAVLGLVWPTVVLPVSLMTGLPPEALRAILAHELAHVRRHDYAVNLAQMFVESLLFFNPAAWWLGRQARIEREACCDAVAVRLTGRPLEYSRVLADWAERVRGASLPTVAMAWSGEGRPSPLLERVLRVLRPGETPRPRVSWTGLAVLILVGPPVLLGLKRGTTEAVALAAQILSPAERVERLEKAQAEYAPPDFNGEGEAILKGTIRVPGGGPPPGPVPATAISRIGNGSSMKSLEPLKATFSAEVPAGRVWLSVAPKDFAPKVVGPFDAKPGATIEGIDIVLEPGFPARVRVVDEHGAAIARAQVNGGLSVDGMAANSVQGLLTDGDGVANIAHAARGRYRMSAQARGFQVAEPVDATLTPEGTTTLTLVHARPTRGVVVAPDGAPIAGATLRPFAKFKPYNSHEYATSEPVMATTAVDGRFVLDALDDDATYAMLIETAQQSRQVVTGVRAGQEGLKWTVGPKLTVTGTIKGDLGTLKMWGGKPVVEVTQRGRSDWLHNGMPWSPTMGMLVPVERVDGGGRFTLSPVLPGDVDVTAGEHFIRLDVDKPDTSVTIDLSAPTSRTSDRRVVLRIVTLDGGPRPSGSVRIIVISPDGARPARYLNLPLREGEVTFEAPVPGQVSYLSESVTGYWLKPGNPVNFDVPPGDGPLVIEIQAVPAGAIVGWVLDQDGNPIDGGVSLSVSTVEKPSSLKDDPIQLNNVRVGAGGRFFLAPLPIGGTYVVVVGRGHNRQISRPVRLDGKEATARVELRLAKPASAGGRVVGPDGRPVVGMPIDLKLDHPQAGMSWGLPTPTDRDGRFRFDDLSSELGVYRVSLDLRKDYQPAEATLNPGGPPVEIKLEHGHVVAGRVVDAATGRPIPGVEMYAHREQYRPGERNAFESEARTDEEGRFRFSNLPAGRLKLGDRDGLNWESDEVRNVSSDQAEAVEIRATLPAWTKLKPVGPPGGDAGASGFKGSGARGAKPFQVLARGAWPPAAENKPRLTEKRRGGAGPLQREARP